MKPSQYEMTNDTREINRQWWEKREQTTLDMYSRMCSGKSFEEDSSCFRSLTAYAQSYVGYAFDFMMVDRQEEAAEAIERAIFGAKEALRTESFDPIFADEVRNTSPYKEWERMIGELETRRWLHYALWFSTGERPLDLIVEMADYHFKYYASLTKKFEREIVLEQLLMDYLEAESFQQAITLFQQDYKGGTSPSRDAQLGRNTVRTVAALANMALGNSDNKLVVEKAVDAWCERSRNWVMNDAYLPWFRRLDWIYLRGRHFTGTVNLQELLLDLRGF